MFQNLWLSMNWSQNLQDSTTICVVTSNIKTGTSTLYFICCISHFFSDATLDSKRKWSARWLMAGLKTYGPWSTCGPRKLSQLQSIVKAWHWIINCTLKMLPHHTKKTLAVGEFILINLVLRAIWVVQAWRMRFFCC